MKRRLCGAGWVEEWKEGREGGDVAGSKRVKGRLRYGKYAPELFLRINRASAPRDFFGHMPLSHKSSYPILDSLHCLNVPVPETFGHSARNQRLLSFQLKMAGKLSLQPNQSKPIAVVKVILIKTRPK